MRQTERIESQDVVYFQNLAIDWQKAKSEHVLEDFNEIKRKGYLYNNQLDNILNQISYIFQTDTRKKLPSEKFNRILSVVGDRGTGKSSFLKTIEQAVSSPEKLEDTKFPRLHVIKKIDPTLFDKRLGIIDLFLSILHSDIRSKKIDKFNDAYGAQKGEFEKHIRQAIEILKGLYEDTRYLARKDTPMELLNVINHRQDFDDLIKKIINNFLALKSYDDSEKAPYQGILIEIDDLDLVKNKDSYQTLNDLFKFLANQEKLVVIIAYREEQLLHSIMDSLLEDNKLLLKEKIITEIELRGQAAKFLEKGLPKGNRVYLSINGTTSFRTVLRPYVHDDAQLDKYLENAAQSFIFKEVIGEKTINQVTIQDLIRYQLVLDARIAINPVDDYELTRHTYPQTLRSTIQYLEMLFSLEPYQKVLVDSSIEIEAIDALAILQDNLARFQPFALSKMREVLPTKLSDILDSWLERNTHTRNSYIISSLSDLFGDAQGDVYHENQIKAIPTGLITRLEQLKQIQAHNVSLGDVFEVMEYFKEYFKGNETWIYFIYCLKILYSFEMKAKYYFGIEKFEKQKDGPFGYNYWNDILAEYTNLVHGKIMPDNFFYASGVRSNTDSSALSVRFEKEEPSESEIISKLCLTAASSRGDVQKYASSPQQFGAKYSSYQYRQLYEKYTEDDKGFGEDAKDVTVASYSRFKRNTNYAIDPFAFVTDEVYMMEGIENFINGSESNYVLLSFFDIDMFVRKNYSRQSFKEFWAPADYVLGRINQVMEGRDIRTAEEIRFHRSFQVPLLAAETTNYREVFSDKLRSDLKLLLQKLDPSDQITEKFSANLIKNNDKYKISDLIVGIEKLTDSKKRYDNLSKKDKEILEKYLAPGGRNNAEFRKTFIKLLQKYSKSELSDLLEPLVTENE